MNTMKQWTMTAVLAGAMAVVAAIPAAAQTPTNAAGSSMTFPVVGSGSGANFTGTFQLQKFVSRDGAVWASGILSGTVTNATGTVGTLARTIQLPVNIGETSCDILHLDLGPLSLDLLGLQIDLSRIVLDITAQAGAGNLLGNLLCAVTNLLNDPSGLAKLLNSILDILT